MHTGVFTVVLLLCLALLSVMGRTARRQRRHVRGGTPHENK